MKLFDMTGRLITSKSYDYLTTQTNVILDSSILDGPYFIVLKNAEGKTFHMSKIAIIK